MATCAISSTITRLHDGVSCIAGRSRPRHATGIRFARLPDPQQRARRQQGDLIHAIWHGRIVSDVAATTRLNAARSAIGDSGETTAPHQNAATQGISFRRYGAGGARVRKRAVCRRTAGTPKPALTLPDNPSIAVLPFANLSSDLEQEYFADGMVDDIITALSRFKLMFVIARNTIFTYKGKAVDIK